MPGLGTLLLLVGVALAQEPAGGAEVPAEDLPQAEPAPPAEPVSQARLPVALDIAPAAYPPAALEAGEEAVVRLELGIDASGKVVDARPVEPRGDDFDQAAVLAALSSRFEPALDEAGQPVAAVILFDLSFSLSAVPTVSLEGRVREAGFKESLDGIELSAVNAAGDRALALSDADGRFAFVGLEPGTWVVAAQGRGLRSQSNTLEVVEGKVAVLELFLVRDEAESSRMGKGEEILVEDAKATSEITERRLSSEDISVLPGTNGDVVKVVQNLPGVARAPLGIGQLIIRGTAPEDSRFFLDGSPIPLVFHFAGLTSILPSDAIEEVAYLPGNYSARYGRTLSGLVDLRTDAELPERSGGYLSVDIYQSAIFHEQLIGERTALTFAARRSYIDAVLTPILSGMDGIRVQAPRYYDGQVRLLHKDDSGATWDALAFLSDDRFRFLGGDQEDETLAAFADQFQRLRLRRTAERGEGWSRESTISLGPERRFFEFGTASDAEEERFTVAWREELGRSLSESRALGFRVGLDVQGGQDSFRFYQAPFSPLEEGKSLYIAPAVYGEATARVGRATLIPGLRTDLYVADTGYSAWSLDPRMSARYRLLEGTTLKASVGRFSTFPSLRQLSVEGDGNPELTPPWALQTSLGVDQQVTGRLSAEVTAFYNPLFDLVVGREDRLRFFTGPPPVGPFDTDPYANDGVGVVYGVESLLRYTGPASVGLVSLTVSHSERRDRPGEPVELFAYDQPVVLNALYSQQLPRNWRLGGRFRYSSGNPYTPVLNSSFDLSTRTWQPVYAERSSGRLPSLYGIDLRIDKTYTFRSWKLQTYLDIQNIAFSQQVEVIGWNYDYSEEEPITGNPPLPVFGLRGEW